MEFRRVLFRSQKVNCRNTARLSRSRRRGRLFELREIGTYSADVRMVPGARIELATPAFSGRRSTNELPRHRRFTNCRGDAELCQFGEKQAANHCEESSNSFIQLRFFRTSRGLVPSGGPTMPSFSIKSISRAARPYPMRKRRCSVEVDARPASQTTRIASW